MSKQTSNFKGQQQRAGKFVASGTYGCTFYPHLKCQDLPNKKKTIGKVFASEEDVTEENNIMKSVKSKLDPTNEFTVPFYGKCKVHYIRETDEAGLCPVVKANNLRDTYQLLYAYAGQPLSKKLRKNGTINGFLKLLPAFVPIFEGLQKMNSLKWVHFDIKPDNMLLLRGKLYLIDFGIVTPETEVYRKNNINRLINDYTWYPPEFKAFFFKQNTDYDRLFKRVMDNFQGSNSEIATSLTTVLKANYRNDFHVFFNDNLPKKEYIKFASKVDVYSLGMILFKLYLWSGLQQKIYKGRTNKVEIRRMLLSLITKMIHFDPRKRATASEANDEFNKIIELI